MSKPEKTPGKSLDEFRALHDKNYIIPRKIQDALGKLGDGWEYEMAFIKLAELSVTDLALFREQFGDYIVTINGRNPKRVWCGTKELAKKLRAMT